MFTRIWEIYEYRYRNMASLDFYYKQHGWGGSYIYVFAVLKLCKETCKSYIHFKKRLCGVKRERFCFLGYALILNYVYLNIHYLFNTFSKDFLKLVGSVNRMEWAPWLPQSLL